MNAKKAFLIAAEIGIIFCGVAILAYCQVPKDRSVGILMAFFGFLIIAVGSFLLAAHTNSKIHELDRMLGSDDHGRWRHDPPISYTEVDWKNEGF